MSRRSSSCSETILRNRLRLSWLRRLRVRASSLASSALADLRRPGGRDQVLVIARPHPGQAVAQTPQRPRVRSRAVKWAMAPSAASRPIAARPAIARKPIHFS